MANILKILQGIRNGGQGYHSLPDIPFSDIFLHFSKTFLLIFFEPPQNGIEIALYVPDGDRNNIGIFNINRPSHTASIAS